MSGTDNPYGGSYGGQMSATASFGGAPAPTAAASLVKDTTTAGFAKDVLDESRKQPVLVDFWAPWCGPCKQLTPVIEKVINEAGGRVKLVKMNIDDHPSVAGQLGIQSIPAVIAFVDGKPVDGFMGTVPESQIREFIDKVAGPAGIDQEAEIKAVLEEAKGLFESGDFEGAAQLYGAVMQADPENPGAIAGIAECMVAAGQHERARELLVDLPEELAQSAPIIAVSNKIEQIEEARKIGDPAALRLELEANPDNHEARVKLAKVLSVEGLRDEAAEQLLTVMRRDRAYDDDGARRQLLAFFDVWGPKDPATLSARRKLSSILFS